MPPVRFQAPSRSNVKNGREIGRMRFFLKKFTFFSSLYRNSSSNNPFRQFPKTHYSSVPSFHHSNWGEAPKFIHIIQKMSSIPHYSTSYICLIFALKKKMISMMGSFSRTPNIFVGKSMELP